MSLVWNADLQERSAQRQRELEAERAKQDAEERVAKRQLLPHYQAVAATRQRELDEARVALADRERELAAAQARYDVAYHQRMRGVTPTTGLGGGQPVILSPPPDLRPEDAPFWPVSEWRRVQRAETDWREAASLVYRLERALASDLADVARCRDG